MAARRARWGLLLAVVLVSACSDGGTTAAPEPSPTEPATPSATVPSAAPSPSDSAPPDDVLPDYDSAIRPISADLRDRMSASHRAGCPVTLDDLRHLRMLFLGFDGQPHEGEMVVHRRYARDVTEVFRTLYEVRFPIERMELVDAYAGEDAASMAANNTSAYNCRNVAGTDRWSNHAFGGAIDINPVQNPYVQGDSVDPPAGRAYARLDRSAGADVPRGVVHADDVVVRAFAGIGWGWGGDWTSAKDYQHFSAAGG